MVGRVMSQVKQARGLKALLLLSTLACMTGCSGFFPPINGTAGGGTTPTSGNFVYVANSFISTVSGTSSVYSITGFSIGTNTLTAISGATETLVFPPQTLAVTPSNSYIYVAGSGVIYGYSISSTGTLTQLVNATGGQALANANIVSMAVSPDGQWLLGLDSNQTAVLIDEFSINSTTGLLTLQPGGQHALQSGATILPTSFAVSPKGDYLAASLGTGGLVDFTFVTSTGVVTDAGALPSATSSSADQAAVFDATSSVLYVAVSGTNGGVYPFMIGSGGSLTQVSGAPISLGTDSTAGPASILIDKSGKYLYVGNRAAGSISGFSIAAGGVLTALSGSPYAAGTTVSSLGYDTTGAYILATASGGGPDLEMFSFDATALGKLNVATTASTGTPTEPAGALAVALTH